MGFAKKALSNLAKNLIRKHLVPAADRDRASDWSRRRRRRHERRRDACPRQWLDRQRKQWRGWGGQQQRILHLNLATPDELLCCMLPTDVTNTSLQHWKSSIQVDNMEQCLSGNTVKASWRWTLRKIIGKNTSDIGQHCIVWPQLLYNTYSAVQIIEPYPTAPSFSDWIVMTRATKLEKM